MTCGDTWQPEHGTPISVHDMTDSHLANALGFVERGLYVEGPNGEEGFTLDDLDKLKREQTRRILEEEK